MPGVNTGGQGGVSGNSTGAQLDRIEAVLALVRGDVSSALLDLGTMLYSWTNGLAGDSGAIQAAGTDFLGNIEGETTSTDSDKLKGIATETLAAVGAQHNVSLSQIWRFDVGDGGDDPLRFTGSMLKAAAFLAAGRLGLGVQSGLEPWFVWICTAEFQQDTPNLSSFWLMTGDPADQRADETDLEYMERVLPGLDWGQSTASYGDRPHATVFFNWSTWELVYVPQLYMRPAAFDKQALFDFKPTQLSSLIPGGMAFGDAMAYSATPGQALALGGMLRTMEYPHFLISVQHETDGTADGQAGFDMQMPSLAVNPDDQEVGETDKAFLERELAAWTWNQASGGQGACVGYKIDLTHGKVYTAVYDPISPLRNRMRHYAYRWSDGSVRSALEDLQAVLAWVPVVLETLPDQSGLNGG